MNRITDMCKNITLATTSLRPVTRLHSVIILNTISKRQDGSDLFRILHTKSFSKFTEASVYYVIAVC